MTDPIRPDEPPAGDAPVDDAPVDDPALAALVTADATDAATPADPGTPAEPVPMEPAAEAVPMPEQPPAAPTVATAPVAPPPAAPPVAAAAPAPVVVQQTAVVAPPRRSGLSTVRRVIAFLFGILQTLLILRIVLLLLNANQDDQIVSAILSITQPFVDPFMGIFQLDSVTGEQGSVLDIAAIVALIGWTLIETLILSLLRLFDRPRR